MPDQALFKAIADPTRREIISLLASGDRNVNDIAARFEMSRPAVAKHLNILKKGGLITVRDQGRERIQSLRPQNLKPVADWISVFSAYWDEKLDNLKTAVEEEHD